MEPLGEAAIRYQTDGKVFSRGEDYWREGAVLSLVKSASSLHAKVEGSGNKPYRVIIRWHPDGEVEPQCNCPYADEYESWCKHIVAVLLAYAHGNVTTQPPLQELLEPLSRQQLVELLVSASERDAACHEAIIAVLQGEEPDDDDEDDY